MTFVAKFIFIFTFLINFQNNNLEKNLHPVHLSVTNIEYNFSDNNFEISFRFFADDFQNIISQKYSIEINLENININKKSQAHITNYINEHFFLTLKVRSN